MRRFVIAIACVACGRIRFDPIADGQASPNIAFVTPDIAPGTLGSLANADAVCQQYADDAGLGGHYIAWLSTTTSAIVDRMRATGARGWVRPDGIPLAATLDDLVSERLLAPIAIEADSTRAPNTLLLAATTGSRSDGTSASDTCSDYTSTTSPVVAGRVNATGVSAFMDGNSLAAPCAQSRVYCFGVDRQASIVITSPMPNRLAFLSSPWTPGGGLAAADAHCQTDAQNAGRMGMFRAALATSTASAGSRLPAGALWARVDGVALAPTAASVIAFTADAPLNVTLDRSYLSTAVWRGALDFMELAAISCQEWQSNQPADTAYAGFAQFTSNGAAAAPCNTALPLMCFEL